MTGIMNWWTESEWLNFDMSVPYDVEEPPEETDDQTDEQGDD